MNWYVKNTYKIYIVFLKFNSSLSQANFFSHRVYKGEPLLLPSDKWDIGSKAKSNAVWDYGRFLSKVKPQ